MSRSGLLNIFASLSLSETLNIGDPMRGGGQTDLFRARIARKTNYKHYCRAELASEICYSSPLVFAIMAWAIGGVCEVL